MPDKMPCSVFYRRIKETFGICYPSHHKTLNCVKKTSSVVGPDIQYLMRVKVLWFTQYCYVEEGALDAICRPV
jgi:hypothetical protein